MNRTLVLTALAAGLATSTLAAPKLTAQAAPAAAPAPAAPTAPVAPQAIPAKVAVISFEQVVLNTNEGQKAMADLSKKYEPKKNAIETAGNELESLKKQLQALPATTTDEERASRMKVIDKKQADLQRDVEAAQNDYQSDMQDAYGKIAQKVGAAAVKYAQENGFTMLVNVGGSQQAPSPFFWWAAETDISQAVVNAYNVSSGVAAPPPPAPSAPKPRTTPAAPKPATKP
jgi:outer membrane protein